MAKQSNTLLPIPARYDYWLHSADTWTHVLNALNISSSKTIWDICCGWSPKIELALTHTDFRGTVYCIDESATALREHKKFITLLHVNYDIRYKQSDILHHTQIHVPKPGLIIGNHILDDLLIQKYCVTHHTDQFALFSKPDRLIQAWDTILDNDMEMSKTLDKFVYFLVQNSTKGTIIALTHYLGYQERLFQYPTNDKAYQNLLLTIQEKLMATKLLKNRKSLVEPVFKQITNPYFNFENILLFQCS